MNYEETCYQIYSRHFVQDIIIIMEFFLMLFMIYICENNKTKNLNWIRIPVSRNFKRCADSFLVQQTFSFSLSLFSDSPLVSKHFIVLLCFYFVQNHPELVNYFSTGNNLKQDIYLGKI